MCSCILKETVFKEQVEGLVEEDDEVAEAANEEEHVAVGAITLSEKKTERQRKKEKAEKLKVNRYIFHFQLFAMFSKIFMFYFFTPNSVILSFCLLIGLYTVELLFIKTSQCTP